MDPVAHTIVGASLAETRLGQSSPFARLTLILGANAPDLDAVTMLINRDLSLWFRRGWTHGVLALAVLPLLLTGLICLLDRSIAHLRNERPRVRLGPLLTLSYIAVLSHPVLDWLNTYGVRFLMPFDGRWFYGDALFIIDPWVWLLSGSAVVIAHSKSTRSITAWLIVGTILTGLITTVGSLQSTPLLLWLGGIAAIAGARAYGISRSQTRRLANVCLVCMLVYILAMVAGSKVATQQVATWLTKRGSTFVDIMAGPVPANPFVRDVIVVDARHYHFLEVNWLRDDQIQVSEASIDRGPRNTVVQAALAAPQIKGLRTWMRFPAFDVEELSDGHRVTIRDIRYARRRGSGFSTTIIELDRNLHPRIPLR